MAATVFGEEVNVIAETDAMFVQLIQILHGNPAFEAALTAGELTEAATAAIASAFDEAFERNRRLADIFLADAVAREQVTTFWFARCYAEVQANKAYSDAFRRARTTAPAV